MRRWNAGRAPAYFELQHPWSASQRRSRDGCLFALPDRRRARPVDAKALAITIRRAWLCRTCRGAGCALASVVRSACGRRRAGRHLAMVSRSAAVARTAVRCGRAVRLAVHEPRSPGRKVARRVADLVRARVGTVAVGLAVRVGLRRVVLAIAQRRQREGLAIVGLWAISLPATTAGGTGAGPATRARPCIPAAPLAAGAAPGSRRVAARPSVVAGPRAGRGRTRTTRRESSYDYTRQDRNRGQLHGRVGDAWIGYAPRSSSRRQPRPVYECERSSTDEPTRSARTCPPRPSSASGSSHTDFMASGTTQFGAPRPSDNMDRTP